MARQGALERPLARVRDDRAALWPGRSYSLVDRGQGGAGHEERRRYGTTDCLEKPHFAAEDHRNGSVRAWSKLLQNETPGLRLRSGT